MKVPTQTLTNLPAMAQPTITLHFVPHGGGAPRTITAACGQSLMKAATRANVSGIAADCGGGLTCATCHVFIDDAHLSRLPPADASELGMLDFTAIAHTANSRLSCQIDLKPELDGLVLHLPQAQY